MTAGRPPKIDPEIEKLKKDTKAVPPEIFEHIGDFALIERNDYLYARLTKSQRPRGFYGRFLSIAKLVWLIHNPDYLFYDNEKLYYVDGDNRNNTIDNLVT